MGLNFDVLYPLDINFGGEPYVGAGLGIFRSSVDLGGLGDFSDTDVGINLKAGALFGQEGGSLQPFGEVGITLGGASTVFARGGVFFSIGG